MHYLTCQSKSRIVQHRHPNILIVRHGTQNAKQKNPAHIPVQLKFHSSCRCEERLTMEPVIPGNSMSHWLNTMMEYGSLVVMYNQICGSHATGESWPLTMQYTFVAAARRTLQSGLAGGTHHPSISPSFTAASNVMLGDWGCEYVA